MKASDPGTWSRTLTAVTLLVAAVVHDGHAARENHAVAIGDGRILAIGPLDRLARDYPNSIVRIVGRAIMPPPVNAHTHLDLSLFPCIRQPLPRFLRAMVEAARMQPGLRGLAGAQSGLKLMAEHRTGAFGDIVARETVMDLLLDRPGIAGVAYWEVIGLDPREADEIFRAVARRIDGWRRREKASGIRVGVAPHSPYLVSHKLLRLIADHAAAENLPVQIHLAESVHEMRLFAQGDTTLLRSLLPGAGGGISTLLLGRSADSRLTPVTYLADLGFLRCRPALVHAVHATASDIEIIAEAKCPVISCPTSNRNLSCGWFPWRYALDRGVTIALGTDSLASADTLNVFCEGDELMARGVPLPFLVDWLVVGGRQALGLPTPQVQVGGDASNLVFWP